MVQVTIMSQLHTLDQSGNLTMPLHAVPSHLDFFTRLGPLVEGVNDGKDVSNHAGRDSLLHLPMDSNASRHLRGPSEQFNPTIRHSGIRIANASRPALRILFCSLFYNP